MEEGPDTNVWEVTEAVVVIEPIQRAAAMWLCAVEVLIVDHIST